MADNLGTGWKFPFQFNDRGRVDITADQTDGSTSQEGQVDHLYGNIYQLVQTSVHERLMRTELGCGIHDFVFQPNDESLVALLLFYVTDVVTQWEPRVEVVDIIASQDPQLGILNATITFRIRRTNEFGNVVVVLGGA